MFSSDTATTLGRINYINSQRGDHLGWDKNWVCPAASGCYQTESCAWLQKNICQEWAESQPQTEVQRQSSKPSWWRKCQDKSQDTEEEGMEYQPVCKAGPGAQGWKHSGITQLFYSSQLSTHCVPGSVLAARPKTCSLFPPRPKNSCTCIFRQNYWKSTSYW